jgi:hypothetical protein
VALWEEVKANLADLSTIIIGGITNWISTDVVEAGLKKLAKLSNPIGEVIELIQTISTTIDFIVTKMNSILAAVDSVLNSLAAIVAGQIGPASEAIEKALVGAIANVLSFLADWTGTKVGETVLGIIEKIQARVDKAVDGLIAKAIGIVQKLLGKPEKKPSDNPKWDAAVAAIDHEIETIYAAGGDEGVVQSRIPEWKVQYGFTELKMEFGDDDYEILGAMSAPKKAAEGKNRLHTGADRAHAIPIFWYKNPSDSSQYEPEIALERPDKTMFSVKMSGRTPIEYEGSTYTLGVNSNYRVEVGSRFKRSFVGERSTPKARLFREILEAYKYKFAGTEIDHVRDLAFSGPDEINNLWPLEDTTNKIGFGFTGLYYVKYRGSEGPQIRNLNYRDLDGKWFCVVGNIKTDGDIPAQSNPGGKGRCP